MNHKVKVNPFLHIFVFASVLVLIAVVTAIVFFYYMYCIRERAVRGVICSSDR